MKKLLIAMTAVAAMAMASTPAFAHDWDGDAWAAKQMTLYQTSDNCVTLSDTDFTLFMKTCDVIALAKAGIALAGELQAGLGAHLNDTTVAAFIDEHFSDAMRANAAIVSLGVFSKGLKLMQLRMELYKEIIQRDREIKKAEEALGLHGDRP
jgi:hypothetical protein